MVDYELHSIFIFAFNRYHYQFNESKYKLIVFQKVFLTKGSKIIKSYIIEWLELKKNVIYRRYREKNAKAEEIDLESICRDEYNF